MKKKLIASITCLSLLLVMLLSSTLAWFTDTDMSHNTMTVGNVSIKQHEVFDESKPLFPAVIADGFVKDADGFWNSDLINNEVNKVVTVENTGSYPAYVRTVFAFEMMWNGTTWEDPIGDEIVLNDYRSIVFDPATPPVIIYRYITNGAGNKAQYYYSAENLGSADAAFVVGIATYFDDPKAALPAGQTTDPSLLQFYLAEDVGNEFYDAVKQRYEILALSQAMQHAGFEDMGIDKAMEKAFGTYNAENAAKWFGTGEFIIPGGNEDVAVNGSPVDSTDTEYVLRGFDVDMFNQGTSEKVASICVPTSALKNGDPRNFRVTMTKTEDGSVTVSAGMETLSYDIDVKGLIDGNTDELKVKLYMGEGMDSATFKMYHYDTEIPCTYDPSSGYVTFRTATFSPFTVVYDKDSVHVPTTPVVPQPGENPSDLPKANVVKSAEYENVDLEWGAYGQWSPTEGLDSQLEAAYTFSCEDTLEQAQANPYATWYCDFVVKLDKDLTEDSIFLGGNYGSFGWIGFHNGDLTLEANTEIPLLGSVTSNPWTYVDVVQNVGTFICGVGDVDDALAGATFTVMLRLTNPENEAEYYNVATITHTFAGTSGTENNG